MKITKRTEDNSSRLPANQLSPVRSLRSMHDAMDKLFSDHFMQPFSHFGLGSFDDMAGFSPKVDVSENEKEIKVRAEIPGIESDDISIEVTDSTLSISGKVEKTNEEKEENYYRMERSEGSFSRKFMLPSRVDTNSVQAKTKNGLITIVMKKQPSEQKKKIEIKK